MQETVILEASQVEESTDAVLKEHAIPAPLSEDMNHLVIEEAQFDEFEDTEDCSDEEDESDSDDNVIESHFDSARQQDD